MLSSSEGLLPPCMPDGTIMYKQVAHAGCGDRWGDQQCQKRGVCEGVPGSLYADWTP